MSLGMPVRNLVCVFVRNDSIHASDQIRVQIPGNILALLVFVEDAFGSDLVQPGIPECIASSQASLSMLPFQFQNDRPPILQSLCFTINLVKSEVQVPAINKCPGRTIWVILLILAKGAGQQYSMEHTASSWLDDIRWHSLSAIQTLSVSEKILFFLLLAGRLPNFPLFSSHPWITVTELE